MTKHNKNYNKLLFLGGGKLKLSFMAVLRKKLQGVQE